MLLHQNTPDSLILPVSIRAMKDGDDFFEFEMEISNGELDTYGTIMDESTLRNFAADAKAGVAILDSHNHRSTGYGRTFDGRYENGKVYAKGRIPLGGEFDGMTHRTSESVINFVKAGQIGKVSVGFYDEITQCMNCSKELRWQWCSACDGYLNEKIEVMGDDGEMKTKLLTGLIIDARLGEISFVHSPSNPETQILRIGESSRAAFISDLNNKLRDGTLDLERYTNIRNRYSIPKRASEPPTDPDPDTDPEPEPQDTDPEPKPQPPADPEPEPQDTDPEPQPEPKRSKFKMDKELKQAKARIKELETELDEVQEENTTLEKENEQHKTRIKELETVEKALKKEEDGIRNLCVEVYTERGTLQKKERSEEQLETYQNKVNKLGLDELRAEYTEQVEQRDIFVSISEGTNSGDDPDGDGTQGGDDPDNKTQTDDDKNRQPFFPGQLRGIGL